MKVKREDVLKVAEEVRTLKEGAGILEITQERFRTILRNAGSDKFKHIARRCQWCNKQMKGIPGATKYCSVECRKAAREKRKQDKMVTSICEGCKKEFLHSRKVKRTFCSKSCQGVWLSRVRWNKP